MQTQQSMWSAVDAYIDQLSASDPIMDAVLARCTAANLPAISVAPPQGKLLMLLAQIQGAKRILEIGTLGGYSTIWLARALPPGGCVLTLELDPRHAEIAVQNFVAAGVADRVELRLGPAIDTLASLDSADPFDFVFIDADKASTADYFRHTLRLTRPGSVIVIDNVIRDGKIIDAQSTDPGVQGIRRFHQLLKSLTGVTSTTIQTVGSKGYDGFTLVRVNRE